MYILEQNYVARVQWRLQIELFEEFINKLPKLKQISRGSVTSASDTLECVH